MRSRQVERSPESIGEGLVTDAKNKLETLAKKIMLSDTLPTRRVVEDEIKSIRTFLWVELLRYKVQQ